MNDSAISLLRGADEPLSGVTEPITGRLRTCVSVCVQDGENVQAPAAAFGVPVASAAPPVPLGQFQTWIDLSTTPPILRMYVERDWIAVFALGTDGTLGPQAPLVMPADPAATAQLATKHYVDNRSGPAGRMMYRGAIDCSAAPNYPAAGMGDVYVVGASGRIGGASGVNVRSGAMLVCMANGVAAGAQADVGSHWEIVQGNDPGQVQNSHSVADGSLVQFDPSGTLILSGGLAFSTDASMAANLDSLVPSQKAVRNALGGGAIHGDAAGQGQLLAWDARTSSFRAADGPGENLLVNSSFDIWQETTTYTFGQNALSTHIADYWKAAGITNSPRTALRGNPISNSRFSLHVSRAPGSVDIANARIGQQFAREESLFLQGKPLTASFDVVLGANFSGGVQVGLVFGTGIDEYLALSPARQTGTSFPTGSGTTLPGPGQIAPYVNTLNAQLPPPGTAARLINQPLTIPAQWGYGPVTEVAFMFDISFAGQAGPDDSISITNVKLEVGNVATPYVRPSPHDELTLCQRRYRKSFARGVAPRDGVGETSGEYRAPALVAGTNVQSLGQLRFSAMRAAPAVRLYNPLYRGALGLARDLVAGDCTATSAQNVTDTGFEIIAAGNKATAAGNTLGVHWVADARL